MRLARRVLIWRVSLNFSVEATTLSEKKVAAEPDPYEKRPTRLLRISSSEADDINDDNEAQTEAVYMFPTLVAA